MLQPIFLQENELNAVKVETLPFKTSPVGLLYDFFLPFDRNLNETVPTAHGVP